MAWRSISTRLGLYSLVGIGAAAVHYGVLVALRFVLPTWLANPLAFLAASVTGYLGHARFTFRPETGGTHFARRWLVLQYVVNLTVCGLLPIALPAAALADLIGSKAATMVLDSIFVFTPTVLNALIWSRAARFSQRRRQSGQRPRLHADDLGLSDATNTAILELIESGQLDGASLLVNGPAVAEALSRWPSLEAQRPHLQLCLHLCLTEGQACAAPNTIPALVNHQGHLHLSFGQWLLLSLLPQNNPRRQRISQQLRREVEAQLNRFRQLHGPGPISLDGHQHIHLVPVVHSTLMALAQQHQIIWMRSTAEPLPTGLPLQAWWQAIRSAGLLKWFVLQILSTRAAKAQRRQGISSNSGFAGVLFTGQMADQPLKACWRALCSKSIRAESPDWARAQLLIHPGAPLTTNLVDSGFGRSQPFAVSPWRQKEWNAVQRLVSRLE